VLKNPDHKCNENKEQKTGHPKVPCQRFHEDPSIFAVVVCNRNNHGDITFCERQGIVDVQGPVVDNSYVSNHGIIILLAINKKYFNVNDIQCDIVTRTEKERASLTFKYT